MGHHNLNLEGLRADIRRMEQGTAVGVETRPPLTTGASEIDTALPWGGLSRQGLHEVLAPLFPAPGMGAATGFAAALAARAAASAPGPVLWCRPASLKNGLYAPGLESYGLAPERLLLTTPKNPTETLWTMEEGLRSGAVSAVLGEFESGDHPLTHTAYRRLQLAAERGGVPCLLLRPGAVEQAAGPVMTRWAVAPAPSLPDAIDAPWLGRPRFDVHLARVRGGTTGHWLMEWTYDGIPAAPGRFAVVADTPGAAWAAARYMRSPPHPAPLP